MRRYQVAVAAIAVAMLAQPFLAGSAVSATLQKGPSDMATLNDLVGQIDNATLRERIEEEIRRVVKQKKFGLVFEDHVPECTPLWEIPVKRGSLVARKDGKMNDVWCVAQIEGSKALCVREGILAAKGAKDGRAACPHAAADGEGVVATQFDVSDLVVVARFGEPIYPYLKPLGAVTNALDSDLWHTLIEADNYHALQFLDYAYAGKVDCIYIDPPYNTGAKDWKYNNDYVDDNDAYRHSKWLSMMQKRLKLAKKLLNPRDSVLIVTIDEKEYLHLGCLLEEMFPEARIQMVSSVINPKGVSVNLGFKRADEYLFFVMLGSATPQALSLGREWSPSAIRTIGSVEAKTSQDAGWTSMMRRGTSAARSDRPGMFYGIYVNPETKTIEQVGEAIAKECHKGPELAGLIQVLPIRSDGSEGRWQVGPQELRSRIEQGRVRVGKESSYGFVINYLPAGEWKKIVGNNEADGDRWIAPTQWKICSHDASAYGSSLLSSIITKRFAFPKSLYAVHDTLRFFVANKPNAIIVDFFAGSGTTLHAVNLLNAEDGGRRQCVMVTNNEVSDAEAKSLTEQGYKPGDEEWEKLGIARYVTWPRTVCSIEGHDVKGQPLKGNYGVEVDDYVVDEEDTVVSKTTGKPTKAKIYKKTKRQMYPKLAEMAMADGFKANAAFFKLGFLDKTSVSLGRQFREMLPTLWMKAGAHGPCPKAPGAVDDMLILPENKFAVLLEESTFRVFQQELEQVEGIETVYLVTDYGQSYKSMSRALKGRTTYQLYRDYLENFRINRGRN